MYIHTGSHFGYFYVLGLFFDNSGYNTEFKNAQIASVAICSTSNHKCPRLFMFTRTGQTSGGYEKDGERGRTGHF